MTLIFLSSLLPVQLHQFVCLSSFYTPRVNEADTHTHMHTHTQQKAQHVAWRGQLTFLCKQSAHHLCAHTKTKSSSKKKKKDVTEWEGCFCFVLFFCLSPALYVPSTTRALVSPLRNILFPALNFSHSVLRMCNESLSWCSSNIARTCRGGGGGVGGYVRVL